MGYFDDNDFKPPPGTYETIVNDASAFISRAGDEYAKVVLEIRDGDHAGRQFEHFMGLSHPVGRRIAMEALVGYGLDTEKVEEFDDLMAAMPELISTQVTATISYNAKDYMEVHIFRQLTLQSDVPSDTSDFEAKSDQRSFAQATGQNDDKIPF